MLLQYFYSWLQRTLNLQRTTTTTEQYSWKDRIQQKISNSGKKINYLSFICYCAVCRKSRFNLLGFTIKLVCEFQWLRSLHRENEIIIWNLKGSCDNGHFYFAKKAGSWNELIVFGKKLKLKESKWWNEIQNSEFLDERIQM